MRQFKPKRKGGRDALCRYMDAIRLNEIRRRAGLDPLPLPPPPKNLHGKPCMEVRGKLRYRPAVRY